MPGRRAFSSLTTVIESSRLPTRHYLTCGERAIEARDLAMSSRRRIPFMAPAPKVDFSLLLPHTVCHFELHFYYARLRRPTAVLYRV